MDYVRAIFLTVLVAGLALLYRVQDSRLALGRAGGSAVTAESTAATPLPVATVATAAKVVGAAEPIPAATKPKRKHSALTAEDYYLQVLARVSRAPGIANIGWPSTEKRVNSDYADLLKYLKLDPATAQAFIDLIVKKRDAGAAVYRRMYESKEKLTFRDALQRMAEERRNVEKELAALLGPEAYDLYDSYADTLPQRRDLVAFKTKLYGAGMDLSWQQEDDLLQMIQDQAQRPVTEEEDDLLYAVGTLLPEQRTVPETEIYLRHTELMNDRYLAAAAAILTPDQLAQYEQYLGETEDKETQNAETYPDDESQQNDDGAKVAVGGEDVPLGTPVYVDAATSVNSTWGDADGGSQLKVSATPNNTLQVDANVVNGWGAGVTFWPSSSTPNSDGSVNAAGSSKIVARINAPAGVTLRFGVLESGSGWTGASSFEGQNGADGEAFRHEGITTEAGWQVYTIPLEDLTLNGGYGNPNGNRTIDAQAVKGLEILVTGGQTNVTMEVQYIRLD